MFFIKRHNVSIVLCSISATVITNAFSMNIRPFKIPNQLHLVTICIRNKAQKQRFLT